MTFSLQPEISSSAPFFDLVGQDATVFSRADIASQRALPACLSVYE
jgi:hypothetical protein